MRAANRARRKNVMTVFDMIVNAGRDAAAFIHAVVACDALPRRAAMTAAERKTADGLFTDIERIIHKDMRTPPLAAPLHSYIGAIIGDDVTDGRIDAQAAARARIALGIKTVALAECFARAAAPSPSLAAAVISEDEIAGAQRTKADYAASADRFDIFGAPALARLYRSLAPYRT
jgi:hypothetical protein